MKVLFLIPPSPDNRRIVRMIDCSYESKASYLWQPNDYLIISALLAAGDDAALIDGTADRLSEDEFFRRIEGRSADLAFFALSSTCWDWDLRIFREFRRRHPEMPCYVIGDVFLEEEYLSFILPQCEGAVYVPHLLDMERMSRNAVRGNTDLPGLHRPGRRSGPASKRPLSASIGTPRHDLFQRKGYVFPFARHNRFTTITTMWGCPFSCSYCNQNGIPPVVRPMEEVARELEFVAEQGVRELFFADKAFGFPPLAVRGLLDRMRASFTFSWSCYFHPQMYRPELLEQMHAAGCHTLIIGVDSADLQGLKQYRRVVEPLRLNRLIDHANGLGIDVCADFIIGLEHETEEDIRRSIDYALGLPVDFASFNIAAPLPGSGIRSKVRTDGKMEFGREGFDTLARSGAMTGGAVGQERVLALRRRAVRGFYLRPGQLWRRLRRTESLEHLLIQCRQMAALFAKN